MQYRQLGHSGVDVSVVCLGSMTWGVQNSQSEAFEQINYALSEGVNFIDTAEMYPVPPSADTFSATEQIIGNWIKANPEKRKQVILATKIAGAGLPWIRGGAPITGEAVIQAVDTSLQRLQTDYIDLFQLHWPNRTTPHFSKHWPGSIDFAQLDVARETDAMLSILQALHDCVSAGKIRFCGLSDDTTWGISQYLKLSDKHALPRMVSIQNEFNLLHWKDWPYLIEHCANENVAYLPWSPLGGGVLSGKYIDGARPPGSRWSKVQRNGLFRDTDGVNDAVKAFVALAPELGLSAAEMANAWVNHIPGVTSTIIGATSLDQLKQNLGAFNVVLSESQRKAITEIIQRYPIPY